MTEKEDEEIYPFVYKIKNFKQQAKNKGDEYILIALPIAQAQRILMDHLSPITPLAPILCHKNPSKNFQYNGILNTGHCFQTGNLVAQ